ncbi:MAG: DUF1850 domain-containing protein [Nitrososphaerales archaeon]
MNWKRRFFLICITLIILLILAYPIHILEVRNISKGIVIFSSPISPKECFTISFIHSVDKTLVKDLFIIQEDNKIKIHESYFKLQCCGAPFNYDDGVLIKEGDWFIMKNITRPAMNTLLLTITSINNYTISLKGINLPLTHFCEDGELVEIKVILKPILFYISGQ